MNVSAKNLILKQRKPVLWVGAGRDMMMRAQSYYGIMNASMILITMYTVREESFKSFVPWLTLPIFFGTVIVLMMALMLFDYKMVYPSQIAFHQHEAYKHRSLIRRDLDNDRKENKRRFEETEKNLRKLMEHFDLEYEIVMREDDR